MIKEHLQSALQDAFQGIDQALERMAPALRFEEAGTVLYRGRGVSRVSGLPGVRLYELITFSQGVPGIAFNLEPGEVGVVMLGDDKAVGAGSDCRRTGRVMDVPVGEELIGRVVDSTGNPVDEMGPLHADKRLPVERPAPPIMDRLPVTVPLQTGLKVIDALIPIGRGQRELILGDRQTGKTAVAIDTIISQRGKDVICIYCSVGQRSSAVAKIIDDLRKYGAMGYTTVVLAHGEDPPGMRFLAPYSATSMAEYFMERGRDVLVVYDDLTHHARSYRELSLLLRRPPGREAYPGDIFYIHSRLLERATHLKDELGGGSMTALPIIETEAQNVSAYIPTNLISITDGQVYLSPDLFQKGQLPAVDVGRSVSRVGGKTQLPAYRTVAGDLRLSYSQFEELEKFARFSTRLDEETRKNLERGRRVRETLKQPQYSPIPVEEQIAVLLSVTEGLFDEIQPGEIQEASRYIREKTETELQDVAKRIREGKKLRDEDRYAIITTAKQALDEHRKELDFGNA